MVTALHIPLKVKVNSLDLARSLPLAVPRSNPCGIRAAYQECLMANPEAFLARRASLYQTKLASINIHAHMHTQKRGGLLEVWPCSCQTSMRLP